MKRIYNSLEELSKSWCNNDLKVCVSSVLALNKREPWKLLSCSEEGGACRSDFVYLDEAGGSVSLSPMSSMRWVNLDI